MTGCRVALVDPSNEPAFLQRAAAKKLAVAKRDTIAGLNLGRGAMTAVRLYVPARQAP
jgi:hypothetical protein